MAIARRLSSRAPIISRPSFHRLRPVSRPPIISRPSFHRRFRFVSHRLPALPLLAASVSAVSARFHSVQNVGFRYVCDLDACLALPHRRLYQAQASTETFASSSSFHFQGYRTLASQGRYLPYDRPDLLGPLYVRTCAGTPQSDTRAFGRLSLTSYWSPFLSPIDMCVTATWKRAASTFEVDAPAVGQLGRRT